MIGRRAAIDLLRSGELFEVNYPAPEKLKALQVLCEMIDEAERSDFYYYLKSASNQMITEKIRARQHDREANPGELIGFMTGVVTLMDSLQDPKKFYEQIPLDKDGQPVQEADPDRPLENPSDLEIDAPDFV